MPEPLRDLGERVWQAMSRLGPDGSGEGARADVEALREEYLQMTEDALDLVRPAIRRQTATARRRARRQLREQLASAGAPEAGGGDDGGTAKGLWRRVTGGSA